MNLAAADILYAVFMAPKVFVTLTASHPDGATGSFLCKFLTDGIVAWVGGVSSMITLVAIAFERFYAVVHPFGNKGNFIKQRLKVRHWKIYM